MNWLLVVPSCLALAACASKYDAPETVSSPGAQASGALESTLKVSQTVGVETDTARTPSAKPAILPSERFKVIYDKPIDANYRLILAAARNDGSQVVTLQVQLSNAKRNRVWHIATLTERDVGHEVVRADSTSVILSRQGVYGPGTSIKLFLHPVSKNLIKQIDFSPYSGLDSIPDGDAAIALGLPEAVIRSLKERDTLPGPGEPWDKYLPQALKDYPMPPSTYGEFARARPGRVEDGYGPDSEIGELPGPLLIDGSRIWIGKTFYDGEGISGVGGVGYYDTLTSAYMFLKIPELVPWSVSSLLLEGQTLWIGLVSHPEGADYGGGLLHYDLRTGTTMKYPVEEVILRIIKWNGRTYLATTGGVSVIEGERVTRRYLVEPALDGKLIVMPFTH